MDIDTRKTSRSAVIIPANKINSLFVGYIVPEILTTEDGEEEILHGLVLF